MAGIGQTPMNIETLMMDLEQRKEELTDDEGTAEERRTFLVQTG